MFRQAAHLFGDRPTRWISGFSTKMGKIMQRRMMPLLAALGIAGVAVAATTVTITCDASCGTANAGLTFEITEITTSFTGGSVPQSVFASMPWWDQVPSSPCIITNDPSGLNNGKSCAAGFARLAKAAGLDLDPEFVFTTSPCGSLSSDPNKTCAYHSTNAAQASEFQAVANGTPDNYAFVTALLPEIDGAQLPKAALLLFSLYMLMRSRSRQPLGTGSQSEDIW